MKKNYEKPAMQVMNIEPATMIANSNVKSVNSNAGLRFDGGGSGPARGREGGDWDED